MDITEFGYAPSGKYKPSFLFGNCPKCSGTLYRTFTREDYSCFNCGFVDTPWARFFLTNPVIPTITDKELIKMDPVYVVAEHIESVKREILHDLPVLGLKSTLKKYKISMSTWYNVKRKWQSQGVEFPKLPRGPNARRAGLVASVGRISSGGATISVSSLMNMIGAKEKELEHTLDSNTWPEGVATFLKAQLEAYQYVKSRIEELVDN